MQGVGYRYALRDEALRLGVTGWVRNCIDGSVQALLQGDDGSLERLVAWARRGPRAARVDELRDEAPQAHDQRPYDAFEIRPSG